MPSLDDAEIAKLPKVGDLLASKYRLTEIIGYGGMGVVFAGQHEALAQSVAIKLLRPRQARSDESIRRFLREARASASLRSAHTARVFDIDSTPEGIPFIVMERLRGESVDRVLETRGAFTTAFAVDCILQACEALAEAHGKGVVHRDLKPSNLFLLNELGGAQSIKVLDFGISKAISGDDDRAETSLTGPNAVLGSPQYMAPEQVMARAVDGRTDVWALGAILFELLTLRPPFAADSVPHLYAMIVSSPATPLRSLLPKAPPKLELVIERCLEKAAAQRPADVGELAQLLVPFASKDGVGRAARIRSMIAAGGDDSNDGEPGVTPVSKRLPRAGSAFELGPTQPADAKERSRAGAIVATTTAAVAVVWAIVTVWRSVHSTDAPAIPAVVTSPSSLLAPPRTTSQTPPETNGPPSIPTTLASAPPPESSATRKKNAPPATPTAERVHDLRSIKLIP